jgi:hypothetical protein
MIESRASQFKLGLHQMIFQRIPQAETELLTNLLHPPVFDKDVTCQALEVFVTTDLDQPTEQFGPQPLSLELVADEQGKLGLICPTIFD